MIIEHIRIEHVSASASLMRTGFQKQQVREFIKLTHILGRVFFVFHFAEKPRLKTTMMTLPRKSILQIDGGFCWQIFAPASKIYLVGFLVEPDAQISLNLAVCRHKVQRHENAVHQKVCRAKGTAC